MRILALEPYYGGSHKAFLEGWSNSSGYEWTILQLPPYKWKWRMRHSAVTFADQVRELTERGQRWDRLWCSDMLNLAEFRGLAPRHIRDLPTVIYFHENQLTYPVRFESERDYQFAVTNVTSALAADAVWFNSGFHRDSFLNGLDTFLRRMPDCQPTDASGKIRQKATVCPPGVRRMPARGVRRPGPLRILWAARWEHDKNPDDLFAALRILEARDVRFRISTVGEQFRQSPEVFSSARREFTEHVDRWGYQEDRTQYEATLCEADVFVSTARHEFFGLSAVEATLAGAHPLLPKRQAYPEVFGLDEDEAVAQFFYDGSVEVLADRLAELAAFTSGSPSLFDRTESLRHRLSRFEWSNLALVLDKAIQQIANHE